MEMSSDTVSLRDVIQINPESIGKNYPYNNIEYLDISSVGTGTLSAIQNLELSQAPSRAKRIVRDGDTILATVRPNLRSFLYIRKLANNAIASTGFAVLRATDKIDKRYLYYCVTHQGFTDYLSANVKGAAYPAVDTEAIGRGTIYLPVLTLQHKIASILSAYDDLIENNLKRIKILEEMAQMIYREWFVNFRFPGHEKVKMVDSPLGKIPEGWEVKKVKEIIKRLKAGKTYKQDSVSLTGNIIVIDQSNDEFLGFHNDEPAHRASTDDPIVIFGDHTCKMQLMVQPFSLGPNVVPFISKCDDPIIYIYYLVHNLLETREYKRHWTELNNKTVVYCPSKITNQFSEMIKPFFEQINTLRIKNMNLRKIRDLLLPKLISGELDVEELDIKISEEAN